MRITGGSLRGRLLRAPKGKATRPTSSRVREAVFDIVGGRITDARVLDLYAGSGALGIEALSRGALFAAFVEASPSAVRAILENLRELELEDRARVIRGSASAALERLSGAGERFTVVFADPPYAGRAAEETLRATAASGVLAPGSLVVVEHTKRQELSGEFGALGLTSSHRYGDTVVSVYALLGG
ncbi:MAG: 16S rRNA (guanine(966)-N(2))-methyltransferase RsmD [Candidatus Eisenbacteria bacterium]|nr:16S rRNA (guanine(966)-N(2))-methyltransferase RsmD [Candidatus Eisenbacteria bacterium]